MVRQDKITFIISEFKNRKLDFSLLESFKLLHILKRYEELFKESRSFLFDQLIADIGISATLKSKNNQKYKFLNDVVKLYFHGESILPINRNIHRFLVRFGIYPRKFYGNDATKLLSSKIPINRHKLIFENLFVFTTNFCTAFYPNCINCSFKSYCDYSNLKNGWRNN